MPARGSASTMIKTVRSIVLTQTGLQILSKYPAKIGVQPQTHWHRDWQ